jgi:hypothetical protein
MIPEAELSVPCSTERENRKFAESPVGLISLRAVAQKLQRTHSFPRGSGDPEGFPHLPLFYFL